jgi:hypothetical protein
MKSVTIKNYQNVLQQFKLLQVEIDYSRYLTDKTDCTIIVENKQSFAQWAEQLATIVNSIQQSSLILDEAINQDKEHEKILDELDTAIDELIQLHMEIISSCAHKTGLMEGRYLIEHVVGHYLDQVSLHINEFRYQLNRMVFNITGENADEKTPLPLPLVLNAEVEIAAFNQWIMQYNS